MYKNKKGIGLGVAAVAAGAGAAAYAVKNHKKSTTGSYADSKKKYTDVEYRNTELGRFDKNSKGIYYTNGNYEAFARSRKPEAARKERYTVIRIMPPTETRKFARAAAGTCGKTLRNRMPHLVIPRNSVLI